MSHKKKIVLSVGTRPEAIKMAPVYLALKNRPETEPVLLATAQHRHMLDQVLQVFSIKPDVDLDLMSHNQTLSELSAKVLVRVQQTLHHLKPDAILVHGDTSTCLFSALAAFYEGIPIGHVEAGLRTHNFQAPWPEEMNRRLTDPISRWCFAPTARAQNNLLDEGIPADHIYITGNTAVDALLLGLNILGDRQPEIECFDHNRLINKRLILITGHRRESFGPQFEQMCLALHDIAEKFTDTLLVYPVHLNPNVQEPVRRILGNHPRILLIEPVEYLSFLYLMKQSFLIITDSGGIQEEAPALQKPVLVTRFVTERPEAMDQGLAKLVGTDHAQIVKVAEDLLNSTNAYQKMIGQTNPYGDGTAGKQIANILAGSL